MSWGLSSGFDSCEDTLMVSEGWSTIIAVGSVAAGEVAESSAPCRQQEVNCVTVIGFFQQGHTL